MIFHSTSKKPVLIVGNGVRESGAVPSLFSLYKKTRIPVLTTMNAVDLAQDEMKIGFIGVYGNRIANMIVAESDLVISVGARLGLRQIGNKKEYFAPKANLIRADIDQYELSRNIKDEEEKYLIDADDFIKKLYSEEIPEYSSWNSNCFEAKRLLTPCDRELGNICIEKVSEILPENPIVTVDTGQHQCWVAQSLHLKGYNGRILIGGSYGSMGCGLPYAVGAAHARKGECIYCITGDGGLQMNIQELQSVASEKLPIKIIVLNNKSLGKISEIQEWSYDKRFLITNSGSGYTVPDFERVANAYGIKSRTLISFDEIEECVSWIRDDEPCLINIILPENTRLQPKMNWNQKEMLPLLDEGIMNGVRRVLNRD